MKIVIFAVAVGLMMSTAAAQQHSIGEVAWLQGCWMASGSRTVEENWTVPRGGSMIGVSRTVRDGKLVAYELVILREKDGTLVYEAHPSGQAVAEFHAISVTPTEVIFENPEHDFPQRVCYRLAGPDSLVAWIEGTIDGKEKRSEFPYTRVSCAGCDAN